MINFNLKTTSISQALRLEKNPFFKFSKFFRNLFIVLTFFFIWALLFGSLSEIFSENASKNLLGGTLLSLSLSLFFFEISLFFESKIKRPRLKYSISEVSLRPEDFNLASFLDFEAAKICQKTLKKTERKKFRTPSQELLLYYLVDSKIKEIDFVFGRTGLSFQEIRKELEKELKKAKEEWMAGFEEIIFQALKTATRRKKERIGVGDILVSSASFSPFFQRFLILKDLKKEDIENLADWYEKIERKISESKRFWEYENLLKRGSIAKDWAAGYAITLDKYSQDLREKLKKTGIREIVGHKKEIKQVERILEKEEINNVLLVGEPGTGRGSIVGALAQRAFLGKSSPKVNHKRILNLSLGLLAAEVTSFEEVESVLEACFSQALAAGNIILVIDEIHNFLSEIPKPGTINISGVLARYLPLSSFQLIAVTTYQGLHTILEKNPSLRNLFEKVEVSEISEKETLELLENFLPFFEKKYKGFVEYKTLREILRLSSRYMADIPFPEKAIRLLDEAISWRAASRRNAILKPEHIKKIVSEKIEIPLEELEKKEKEILLNLEELIHQRIINQEEAVDIVSAALRRARAEVQIKSGPIGTFLFLGPTGVGKTETSKALAQIYFGSEKRMIRLDMSEFQEIKDIKRLLGAPGEEGLLTTPVRENPFSLVLLDEIEKTHPNILNLFLQILDEGWVTAGSGRKVDFKNTIIIATSNAGGEVIRQEIKERKKIEIVKEDLLDYLLKERVFRPEFINRFDSVVVFKPLTKINLLSICQLILKKLVENLKDKGIDFEITEDLKEKIVELGYSPEFGAREIRRVIQDKIENILAQAILSGKIKRGNKIKIKVGEKEFSLIVE